MAPVAMTAADRSGSRIGSMVVNGEKEVGVVASPTNDGATSATAVTLPTAVAAPGNGLKEEDLRSETPPPAVGEDEMFEIPTDQWSQSDIEEAIARVSLSMSLGTSAAAAAAAADDDDTAPPPQRGSATGGNSRKLSRHQQQQRHAQALSTPSFLQGPLAISSNTSSCSRRGGGSGVGGVSGVRLSRTRKQVAKLVSEHRDGFTNLQSTALRGHVVKPRGSRLWVTASTSTTPPNSSIV